MTWKRTILFAVLAAVLAAVLTMVPALKETSFHNIGVCLEAWVLLALIVVLNCSSWLEAGLKTLVFFLISQPLIYLIQVPFSTLGFGLFRYYRYWAVVTLLTFPGAILAWFLKKHNWFSVLVLTVINLILVGLELPAHLETLLQSFPRQLLACIFIFAEVIFLLLLCLKDKWKRIAAGAAAVAIFLLFLVFFTNILGAKTLQAESVLSGEGPFSLVSCDEGINVTIKGNCYEVEAETYGTYEVQFLDEGSGEITTVQIAYDENGVSFY